MVDTIFYKDLSLLGSQTIACATVDMTRHVQFFTAISIFAVHLRHIVCFLQFAVRNRVLDLLEIRICRGRETTDSTAGGKKKNGQNTEFREFREIQEIGEIREIPGFAGEIHRKKTI